MEDTSQLVAVWPLAVSNPYGVPSSAPGWTPKKEASDSLSRESHSHRNDFPFLGRWALIDEMMASNALTSREVPFNNLFFDFYNCLSGSWMRPWRGGDAMADPCGTEGLLAWVLIDPLVFDLGGQE